MDTDVRWKQGFSHFFQVLGHLEQAASIPDLDTLQRAGFIQFFEMAFELAWKTLKDLLEAEGFVDVSSPRATLKRAFELGMLIDGEA